MRQSISFPSFDEIDGFIAQKWLLSDAHVTEGSAIFSDIAADFLDVDIKIVQQVLSPGDMDHFGYKDVYIGGFTGGGEGPPYFLYFQSFYNVFVRPQRNSSNRPLSVVIIQGGRKGGSAPSLRIFWIRPWSTPKCCRA